MDNHHILGFLMDYNQTLPNWTLDDDHPQTTSREEITTLPYGQESPYNETYNKTIPPYFGNTTETIITDVRCINDADQWKTIHDWVLGVGAFVFIFVGTIGNIVIYCVLSQKVYVNNLIASALQYLSVLDTIILWTVMLNIFTKGAFDVDVLSTSYEMCALGFAFKLIITSIDYWLLVLISLTRLVYLVCPFRGKTFCSKFKFYLCLAAMHIVIAVLHGGVYLKVYLESFQHKTKKLDENCYFAITGTESGSQTTVYINVALNFVGPMILLFFVNLLMLEKSQNCILTIRCLAHTCMERNRTRNVNQNDVSQNALSLQENETCSSLELVTSVRKDIQSTTDAMMLQGDGLTYMETSLDLDDVQYGKGYVKEKESAAGGLISMEYFDIDSNTNGLDEDSTVVTGYSTGSSEWTIPASEWTIPVANTIPDRATFDIKTSFKAERRSTHQKDLKMSKCFSNEKVSFRDVGCRRVSVAMSMTKLLFVSNLVFLGLNVPFWVFHIFYRQVAAGNVKGCYLKEFIPYAAFLLRFSSHSMHFYFYFAAGSRFRRDLYAWMREFRRSI